MKEKIKSSMETAKTSAAKHESKMKSVDKTSSTMKNNSSLIAAIIFAAVIVSGSLIFLATQMGANDKNMAATVGSPDLQKEIAKGIEAYVEQKEKEYQDQMAAEQANSQIANVDARDLVDNDPFMGDANAPVTIVEFSDYECPYCGAFINGAYDEIKEKYVKTGKVKLVFRDYPLSFHPGAYPAALAAECAREQGGDEVYFKMHDLIFSDQSKLSKEQFLSYVQTLNLNQEQFTACYDSEKFKDEIYADQQAGSMAGVEGTPGFVINGSKVAGAQDFSYFESIIEAELAKVSQ